MAKKHKPRKKSGKATKPKQPSRTEQKMIWQIETLLEEEQFESAFILLTQMLEDYPNNVQALDIICDLSLQMEAWPLFIMYAERKKSLVKGEEKAYALNNLVYAYMQLEYPGIVLSLCQQFLNEFADVAQAEIMHETSTVTEEILQKEAMNIPELVNQPKENIYRFYLKQDQLHYESLYNAGLIDTEEVANEMWEIVPNYIPTLNNMSRIYYQKGNSKKAHAYAEQVLDQDPQNMIALTNIIEYKFFEAKFEQAHQHLKALLQIESTDPDIVTSQIKASAILGEEQSIIDAYAQLKRPDRYNVPPVVLHWVGSAHYRSGKTSPAKRLWQKAVEHGYFLAQDSLDELEYPKAERHGGWYWPLTHWIVGKTQILDMASIASSDESAIKRLLESWPQLPKLFPYMLSLGDAESQEFVLALIDQLDDPAYVPDLTAFANSQNGTPEQRSFAQELIEELTSGGE